MREQREAQRLDDVDARVEQALGPEAQDDGATNRAVQRSWISARFRAAAGEEAEDEPEQDAADQHRVMMLERARSRLRQAPARAGAAGRCGVVAAPAGGGGRVGEPRGGRLAEERDRSRLDGATRIGDALDVVGPDERIDHDRVELDAGELAQLGERLLGGERRHAVRAGGGHRLEGVGHVEDAGELRDLVADEPVRVARAVVPLVVVPDDRQLGASLVTGAMICAPSTGCAFMIIRSSLFSRSCLSRTRSGTPILPTSWSRPPHSRASSSPSLTCITRPMSTAISLTRWLCFAVNGSRLSTASASAPIVWVNISRISMKRCVRQPGRVERNANSAVAHH